MNKISNGKIWVLARLKWVLNPSLLKYLVFRKKKQWPRKRIFLFSLAKSGTHLAHKLIHLVTHQDPKYYSTGWIAPNQYYYHHRPRLKSYSKYLNNPNYLLIINIRDPRDVCLSTVRHLCDSEDAWADRGEFKQLSFYDQLMKTITSMHVFSPKRTGADFSTLIKHPNTMTIRFEDLVGPDGGGNREAQLQIVQELVDRLELFRTKSEILDIADSLFGTKKNAHFGSTFRQGQIGDWKVQYTEDHKEVFKEHLGDLLIDMGYEKDHNW